MANPELLPALRQDLQAEVKKLKAVLPESMSVARFCLLVDRAAVNAPALMEPRCRASFLNAVHQAAEIGLEPNSPLQHGWLIPYGSQVQFQIGYKGYIYLALLSGEVISLRAHVVYATDLFRVTYGLQPDIQHEPDFTGPRTDDAITFAYAVATLKNGSRQFEVMTRAEVDKIKAGSRAASSGSSPWQSHFAEMAKKTAVRRLAKYLPLSSERWSKALEVDDQDLEKPAMAPGVRESKPLFERPAEEKQSAFVTGLAEVAAQAEAARKKAEPPMREPGDDDR